MSDHPALPPPLDDAAFDQTLIAAAFRLAASEGWRNLRIAAAARAAGLPLARARLRFPTRGALLVRFGRMADATALAEPAEEGSIRDRLFGMLMRRLDAFQAHREGVRALLGSLPFRPQTTLFLGLLTEASMRWILDAAGASTTGLAGRLRVKGLVGVWLWTLRAWERDETADLGPTMAVLDTALARAERAAGWLDSLPLPRSASRAVPPGEASAAQKGPGGEEPQGEQNEG
ncbi:MAG: TetR family transcriptional regulator [Rhodospirillales bacterium]|nr:TetR family transcriptional regulator [Rhodospirillales bacterium]